MKAFVMTLLALTTTLLSALALAEPSIFGLQLAHTSEAEFKNMYRYEHVGTNKFSDGAMYEVNTNDINFDGLKEVTVIFDRNGVLAAVLTKFPGYKFDALHTTLGGKYSLVRKSIPHVGNKVVVYREGSTEIELNDPHMSFDLTLNYITDAFNAAFARISEEERKAKQASEASQL